MSRVPLASSASTRSSHVSALSKAHPPVFSLTFPFLKRDLYTPFPSRPFSALLTLVKRIGSMLDVYDGRPAALIPDAPRWSTSPSTGFTKTPRAAERLAEASWNVRNGTPGELGFETGNTTASTQNSLDGYTNAGGRWGRGTVLVGCGKSCTVYRKWV